MILVKVIGGIAFCENNNLDQQVEYQSREGVNSERFISKPTSSLLRMSCDLVLLSALTASSEMVADLHHFAKPQYSSIVTQEALHIMRLLLACGLVPASRNILIRS